MGEIRTELRRLVGDSTYEMWLAPPKLRSWDGRVLWLEAPADTSTWIPKRYGHALQRSVRSVLGPEAHAEVVRQGAPPSATRVPAVESLEISHAFNPRHNFNQFVIGEGNRMAHAASLAIAEQPGQAHNPLFIHAAPGHGKTHLLHAIGNYVLAFGDDAVVRYTTAETFTNHFINALSSTLP